MDPIIWPNENAFNKEFLSASQETNIPVSTLKGFAAMESAFNPKAYRLEASINDASYGLMQILNRTAQGVGFTGTPDQLYDPLTNVRYGAKFLQGLLKKYPDLSQAVAAYNMGSPRKASATTPAIVAIYGQPTADWVYANQPYVDRVMSYIAYFQTFEDGDANRRAQIADLIKKKITTGPLLWPKNPWFRFFAGPHSPGAM